MQSCSALALPAVSWLPHAALGALPSAVHLLRTSLGSLGKRYCREGESFSVVPLAPGSRMISAMPKIQEEQHQLQQHRQEIPAVNGQIHSVESFSAVDGPGLRYIVFEQGCAMRCKFCSNPDTWSSHQGSSVSSKDIAAAIQRVEPYLRPGGGGVTCSGGEPLLQPDFTAAIFQEVHEMGLTTCLDTTGQGSKHHNWDKVLPHTDMVLFCIKHLDAEKYSSLTGLRQIGALKFAAELKQQRIPFWVRYVLIPGHTDDASGIRKLIAFCQDQPSLMGVELLPYHLLGRNKWEEMKLKYPLAGVSPPSAEQVLEVVGRLEDAGVPVVCDAKRRGPAEACRAALS